MPTQNRFKQGLLDRKRQIGAWLSIDSTAVAELFAGAGYDWVLVDMEHAPNDLRQVLDCLRAAKGGSEIVVRVPWNDPVTVKRLLDIGSQSLMFPFVQNAEEARAAVAATRYPPKGIRGVAGTTRATDYGRRFGYIADAANTIAVVVQIETPGAIANSGEIARVEGVDGVFIGSNDLAANMGYLGNPTHPEVRTAMLAGVAEIHAAGKSSGTLSYAPGHAASPFQDGFDFLGAAFDSDVLVRAARDTLAKFSALRDIE